MQLALKPSAVMLNLSAAAYFLGITVVTWCISRWVERHPIWKKKARSTLPWTRLCLLLVLIDTWVYLFWSTLYAFVISASSELTCFAGGMLLYGAPAHHEQTRCSVAMIGCTLLYGADKAFIYLCLIERVGQILWVLLYSC